MDVITWPVAAVVVGTMIAFLRFLKPQRKEAYRGDDIQRIDGEITDIKVDVGKICTKVEGIEKTQEKHTDQIEAVKDNMNEGFDNQYERIKKFLNGKNKRN